MSFVANDGFASAEAKSEYNEFLDKLKQAQEVVERKEDEKHTKAAELAKVRDALKLEERGEAGAKEDTERMVEDMRFVESQVDFYDDGVKTLERLYKVCVEELERTEGVVADKRLEFARKRAGASNMDSKNVAVLEEHAKLKAELGQVREEWAALQGEVGILREKHRGNTNAYIAAIDNDYKALREWRKFKYFGEMVGKLKGQLKDAGVAFKDDRPDRLYAAVLKEKVPLEQWIDFTKTQLTRTGSDEGTPMELDDQSGKIHQMLEFLAERGRLVEQRTWPE